MSATVLQHPETATRWRIDAAHSTVEFAVKHLMITTVKGVFRDVQGHLVIDDAAIPTVDVRATIHTGSVDTRIAQRDAHLRSPDFFDSERFPEMQFVGGRIEGQLDGAFTLRGDLTIRDVTKPIALRVVAQGTARDPWGGERTSYSAKATIKRSDWGLTWNQALETGGVVVGDEIKIELDVQLIKEENESPV